MVDQRSIRGFMKSSSIFQQQQNILRKKVYGIQSSTYTPHTDHHWLFERNIYTHFQYITTFNNNMHCENLEREESFCDKKKILSVGDIKEQRLYWGRSNIFISSLYQFIEDKKSLHDMLHNRPSGKRTDKHTYIQTYVST